MRNFDNFVKESQKQGENYTVFGKTHYLPATIPAGTVFMLRKMGKIQELNSNAEIAEDMFWDLFGSIFSKDNLGEWRKEPSFSYELATEMLKEAMVTYGVNNGAANTSEVESPKVITQRNRKK